MGVSTQIFGGCSYQVRDALVRVLREAMELPGIRLLAKPLYKSHFRRPFRRGNLYFGVYGSYELALEQAQRLASHALPATYDVQAAASKYLDYMQSPRACDYPAMYWLKHIVELGGRRVFDLGGHLGLAYYSFRHYIDYPPDLTWHVHDLPQVMSAGRTLAQEHGVDNVLAFIDHPQAASGCDVMISTGAIQYLPYRLPSLIDELPHPPRHVLLNLIPLHPERSFFTLQNLGIAVCPYRIESTLGLISDMAARGYRVRDSWMLDRGMRIPFEWDHDVENYYGYYFERA